MSKNSKQMVVYKSAPKAPKPKAGPMRRMKVASSAEIDRLAGHIGMVADPCNGPITRTAYRGADGIVTRFKNVTSTTNTVGKSGFVHAFYPAYNSIWAAGVNPSDTPVPNFASLAGPGQSFLLSNAQSQRVVGACVTINYRGTELDRSGVLYLGNLPVAALASGFTVDQLAALCQHNVRVSDGAIDVKWNPSAAEEEYWDNGAATPDSPGERNVIVVIGQNFPSATALNFALTNTLVCEWRPNYGIGLVEPPPSSADVPAGLERVRTALSSFGDWWVSAAHTSAVAIRTGTRMYQAARATRGVYSGAIGLLAA